MKRTVTLTYDGSFEGFLCCVFSVYEQGLEVSAINRKDKKAPQLFSVSEEIITTPQKADRVTIGLLKIISGKALQQLYWAFLSELPQIEMQLLKYVQYIFENNGKTERDFSHPAILKIAQAAKKVSREKHRMEAFVRFKLSKDDIYFAKIEPNFNVLPLILTHFESRYADQKWIIYDIKRKTGCYYDLNTIQTIHLDNYENGNFTEDSNEIFTNTEAEYEELWQNYFISTNIPSRKNSRLHLQHIPIRYWKHLSEKSPCINKN